MKQLLLIFITLFSFTAAPAQSIKLTGKKNTQDTQLSVDGFKVTQADQKTMVTMDFVLDSMKVRSARYRAFTPILRSKDGTQQQRLKSLLVSGRVQDIVFERDGIDPLYADNCQLVRRDKNEPQRVGYVDVVDKADRHKGA